MKLKVETPNETMQVKLLRSMHIRGEYHAAGTVVAVNKRDGREMIYQERAVPFVAQAAPAQAPAAPASGPADEVTAQSEAPIPSAKSDETVGGAQPSESAPAADAAPAKRTRRAKAAPASAPEAPSAE